MVGPVASPLTHDAVIVVPGIMGSELVETATGRVLWGLSDPRWYAEAWTTGATLTALQLTEDERAGRLGRIAATQLLRAPAFAPVLRGTEPYNGLLTSLGHAVAHPDALLQFPYDWRLSVAHNAGLLADAAEAHLTRWRQHPQGNRDAQLVLVAHSMGGLMARYFTGVLGDGGAVRMTVTLGTPFLGSVKAAYILSTGWGTPILLPRHHLRTMARTLPGLYDLLPWYRCVDEGDTARALVPADVASLGADVELAEEAQRRHAALATVDSSRLRTVAGMEQPTMQSLLFRNGVAREKYYTCEDDGAGGLNRVDRHGDSIVYAGSATVAGVTARPVSQSHNSLANSADAIAYVLAVLADQPPAPPATATPPAHATGIELPDVVAVNAAFDITLVNTDDPAEASCRIIDISRDATGAPLPPPVFLRRDGAVTATVRLPRPGVYRVEAQCGDLPAVTQLVMAADADDLADRA